MANQLTRSSTNEDSERGVEEDSAMENQSTGSIRRSTNEDPERGVREGRIDWAMLNKDVSSEIKAGDTLKGTTLQQLMSSHTGQSCGIVIQNLTRSELAEPQYVTNTGFISLPPQPVPSGHKQAMVSHKKNFSMLGCSGAVSWILEDKRVVLAWYIPFIVSNKIAVGFTSRNVKDHKEHWFRTMMDGRNDDELKYRKHLFRTGEICRQIVLTSEDDQTELVATMGNGNRVEATFIVRPTKFENLFELKNSSTS